jgi:hypothetical protein
MDAAELIETAKAEAGLEDFGGESFRQGLEVLVTALVAEGELSEAGRHVARGHLLRLLTNRLRIEDWYRRHPEIERQQTPAPIFVLGLPRTGTTALSARLARDPDTRSLRGWESRAPVPPPKAATQDTDPRIEHARAEQEAMHTVFPELKRMYDATPTDPTECQDLLGMSFETHHFSGQYWVPSYGAWLLAHDMTGAYRYHQRTLKLLQWRCPPNRWHLKTPVHMLALDALDRVYPDARFIMTHRDPAAVLGSVCALIQVTRSMASNNHDPHRIGREQLELWPLAIERAMAFRERAGEERFADVFFAEQLADPVGVVERAYEKLRIPFTQRAREIMTAWAETHRRGRHGSYTYRLEDYGLDADHVRERFRLYIERFALELEDLQ